MKSLPLLIAIGLVVSVAGCDRMTKATPQERVGYLRELVRARTVAGDSIPIDGCSVNRFMDGLPTWRDSLVPSERRVIADVTPCADNGVPVVGRFVLTEWHKNWSGEYVIRGTTRSIDLGYRFTDGIFVGRETMENQASFAGITEGRKPIDTLLQPRGDSTGRAGTVGDTLAADSTRDTTRSN